MEATKEQLLEKGWKSIGFVGVLEYFSKEDEFGAILYIPVYDGKTTGIVQSTSKGLINLLSNLINKEEKG